MRMIINIYNLRHSIRSFIGKKIIATSNTSKARETNMQSHS